MLPAAVELVQAIAKFLAGLEERHEFFGDRNGRARPRIAPLPRCAMLHCEGAEAAKLDTVTARQRIYDFIEDDVDDALHITMVKMRIGGRNLLHKLRLDHVSLPSNSDHLSLFFRRVPN